MQMEELEADNQRMKAEIESGKEEQRKKVRKTFLSNLHWLGLGLVARARARARGLMSHVKPGNSAFQFPPM